MTPSTSGGNHPLSDQLLLDLEVVSKKRDRNGKAVST